MREKKNKNDNVNDVNGKRDNKKAAGKFKNWTTALSMELREHKSSAIVYFYIEGACDHYARAPTFESEL